MKSGWLKFSTWSVKGNNQRSDLNNKIKFMNESASLECGEKQVMIGVR